MLTKRESYWKVVSGLYYLIAELKSFLPTRPPGQLMSDGSETSTMYPIHQNIILQQLLHLDGPSSGVVLFLF